jgi:predicted permease
VVTASFLSPKRVGRADLSKITFQVVSFPPFVALLATYILWFVGVRGEAVLPVFERLANTLVPVALVSVGFQIQFSRQVFKKHWRPVTMGLAFKLILAPLMFYTLYCVILGSRSLAAQVTVLEAAMATMITAGVVAEEFGFDSNIVSLMLGISIPLSLFTVPLWNYFLFQ